MAKKLLLIPALLVVAAACYWALQGREAFDHGGDVTVYGNLDIREVNLAFNAAERIREILVQEGDRIAPGQVLARLDTMRLDAAVAAAGARREAQAQVLARLQAGSSPKEIRRTEAQLAALQARARSIQITHEGVQKLAAQKLSAPEGDRHGTRRGGRSRVDEPTSGVDPLARREFWACTNALAEFGVTILVSTHFMDEANDCDRLVIMAEGTPADMKALSGHLSCRTRPWRMPLSH